MTKLTNKKAFTIMEMLIVVAIIAVLVAIAIPTFNGALTKAKEAADVANIRAAYAETQVAILTDDIQPSEYKTTFEKAITDDSTAISETDKGGLNYVGTSHGYSYGSDGATITYTAEKLKNSSGTLVYTWKLESPTVQ